MGGGNYTDYDYICHCFFVFTNVSVENSKRQSQMLLDKTVEELDAYFAQAQEGMNLMVTDINVQNAIDNYVTGTYKEKLDLRDFIRNRLTNMSTVGRRTGTISIYIKDANQTFSRDFSDQDLGLACSGAPWFEALLSGRRPLSARMGTPCRTGGLSGFWRPILSASKTERSRGWSMWNSIKRR